MARIAGTRLGPYEIISPTGKGGQGEVYRARDTKLERDVAIKSFRMSSQRTKNASLGSSKRRSFSRR